jgi:hypothetical protein
MKRTFQFLLICSLAFIVDRSKSCQLGIHDSRICRVKITYVEKNTVGLTCGILLLDFFKDLNSFLKEPLFAQGFPFSEHSLVIISILCKSLGINEK